MSRQNYGYLYGSAAKRYPRYFRCLREYLINGKRKISSTELAERLGITPSQVRADLNAFDGIGQQGYGYPVKQLYTEISRELGIADGMTAIVIGGDAAMVTLLTTRFESRGITVTGHVSAQPIADDRSFSYAELAERLTACAADIAVLLEWPEAYPDLPELLVSLGIVGIWNLTQTDLHLPIPVLNLPIGDIILSLCCDVRHYRKEEPTS
ncbi:MAG: hypothetical protein E7618_05630 [Ruminococcaceae bacterium]|nr:hypothetical protein [Oscillospiraceae bacterium]